MNARHTVQPGFPEQHRQGKEKKKTQSYISKSNLLGPDRGGDECGVERMLGGAGHGHWFCFSFRLLFLSPKRNTNSRSTLRHDTASHTLSSHALESEISRRTSHWIDRVHSFPASFLLINSNRHTTAQLCITTAEMLKHEYDQSWVKMLLVMNSLSNLSLSKHYQSGIH